MLRVRTGYDSSVNVSTKIPSSSSALSILLAYSPMIHMSEALASGSSSSSRFAHSVGMTPSYVDGYLRNMSCVWSTRAGNDIKAGTYLHDHDCLLHYIADTSANQLQKDIHAALCCFVDLDCCLANRLDTPPHEIDVDLRCVPGSYGKLS